MLGKKFESDLESKIGSDLLGGGDYKKTQPRAAYHERHVLVPVPHFQEVTSMLPWNALMRIGSTRSPIFPHLLVLIVLVAVYGYS